MTLLQLRDLFRVLTGDTETPPLWADEEVDEFANDATREACRRARLLVDSTGTASEVSISTGEPLYELHPSVLFVRRVKLASRTDPTPKASVKDLDANLPGWESLTGEIIVYCTDYQRGHIRFVKTPTADDTATLTVVRLPLEAMTADGDKPEIAERYHRDLLDWMLYRAYLKHDAETENTTRAKGYLDSFTRRFGPPSAAYDEAWIDTHHGYDDYEGIA